MDCIYCGQPIELQFELVGGELIHPSCHEELMSELYKDEDKQIELAHVGGCPFCTSDTDEGPDSCPTCNGGSE